jgi:hypothetical protein
MYVPTLCGTQLAAPIHTESLGFARCAAIRMLIPYDIDSMTMSAILRQLISEPGCSSGDCVGPRLRPRNTKQSTSGSLDGAQAVLRRVCR